MDHPCNQVIGRNIKSDYTKDGLLDWLGGSKQTQKELKKIVRGKGYMKRMGLVTCDDHFE